MTSARADTHAAARRSVSARRRWAARGALVSGGASVLAALVAVSQNVVIGASTVVGLFVVVVLAWQSAFQAGALRAIAAAAAATVLGAVLAGLVATGLFLPFVVVASATALTAACTFVAFGGRGSAGGAWRPVPATARPVLLINPRSGGGAAERAHLAAAAREREVEVKVLRPDDDLETLARGAVADGADALGMAGGDGSQALVADIAAEHDLAFVCVPAGTRNHLALDLGVRREDVVGALDAFTDGVEARVDLGSVNGRTFVNNVSLGVYAVAVQDPAYRDAKARTLLKTARSVQTASDQSASLSIVDDRGREHASPDVVLVSNNPYATERVLGRNTRPRLDGAQLGIVVVARGRGASRAWAAPSVEIDGPAPAAVAIDGEAVRLTPPLAFASRPGALRVRIAAGHPGLSPSGRLPPRPADAVPRLLGMALTRRD